MKKIYPKKNIKNVVDFLEKYSDMAIMSENKYHIPAEVILAQCALETGWGKIVRHNNLFNITDSLTDYWDGKYYELERAREVINGKIVYINQKFRAYNSAQESFDDYCRLITTMKRYSKAVEEAKNNNVKGYIKEIANAGYATDAPKEIDGDPSYEEKINIIIDKYFSIETNIIDIEKLLNCCIIIQNNLKIILDEIPNNFERLEQIAQMVHIISMVMIDLNNLKGG